MRRSFHSSVRWATCLLSCVTCTLTACRGHENSRSTANGESPASPVQYEAVTEQPVEGRLELSAKVQADPTKVFRIFPPASGRILGIRVEPGDTVARGQTLAIIDSADAASARSDYAKAQIEAERAKSAANREKVLFDHGGAAEKDYIDTKAAADSAVAEVARARQRLEMLNLNPSGGADHVGLASPAQGVVLTVSAAPGEFSKSLDNADPLVTIADLSTVWIMGDVFEKDIANVQPGKRVTITVDAYPGRQWAGRIDSLSGSLDPLTRTLKVRVPLNNAGLKLKPEMFAAIHVDIGTHTAIVIPASAVLHEGKAASVFVEENGKPAQRTVTIGQVVDGKVEITSGLQAGQQIAVHGAELLTGGPGQQ